MRIPPEMLSVLGLAQLVFPTCLAGYVPGPLHARETTETSSGLLDAAGVEPADARVAGESMLQTLTATARGLDIESPAFSAAKRSKAMEQFVLQVLGQTGFHIRDKAAFDNYVASYDIAAAQIVSDEITHAAWAEATAAPARAAPRQQLATALTEPSILASSGKPIAGESSAGTPLASEHDTAAPQTSARDGAVEDVPGAAKATQAIANEPAVGAQGMAASVAPVAAGAAVPAAGAPPRSAPLFQGAPAAAESPAATIEAQTSGDAAPPTSTLDANGFHAVLLRGESAELQEWIERLLQSRGIEVGNRTALQSFADELLTLTPVPTLLTMAERLQKDPSWLATPSTSNVAAPPAVQSESVPRPMTADTSVSEEALAPGTDAQFPPAVPAPATGEAPPEEASTLGPSAQFSETAPASSVDTPAPGDASAPRLDALSAQTAPENAAKRASPAEASMPGADGQLSHTSPTSTSSSDSLASPLAANSLSGSENPEASVAIAKLVDLSEGGYRIVAGFRDAEAMKAFIRRVVEMDGGNVYNDGDLEGLVPFYDGEAATQSFERLRWELQRVSWTKAPAL